MTSNVDLIKDLVISPAESKELAHAYLDDLASMKGKFSGVPSALGTLDEYLNPLREGQLRVILGRPSNGKSALMVHFARVAAQGWTPKSDKAPPIFVSAEMAVEELLLREVSHAIPVDSRVLERGLMDDWKAAHDAVEQMVDERPIVYVGHSLKQGRKRPRLSVENIWRSLEFLQDQYGATPSLVCLDYAQRLRLDKATRDRRIEISEIVETVKDMALGFATPIILGSQVGRQVDERKPPVPDMSDGKESGSLEETADSIISVMRPSRYYPIDEIIPGTSLPCSENLFFINILKQRQGIANKGVWCYFQMDITKIADLEVERWELNDY